VKKGKASGKLLSKINGSQYRDGVLIPFAKSAPLFAQSDECSPIRVIGHTADAKLPAAKPGVAKDEKRD